MTARSRSRTKRAAAARPASKVRERTSTADEPAEAGATTVAPGLFFWTAANRGPSAGRFSRDDARGLTAPSMWRPGRPAGTGVLSRVGSRHPSGPPLEAALGNRCSVTVGSRHHPAPLEAGPRKPVFCHGGFAASSGPSGDDRERVGARGGGLRWRTLPRRGGPREFRGTRQQQSNATSYHEGDSKSPASEGRLRRPRPTSHLQSSWSTDPPHRKKAGTTHGGPGPLVPLLRLAGSERVRTANRPAPRRPRAACPP